MKTPIRVFYSYSHEDEEFLKQLKDALAPLRRQKIISEWYDRMISPGSQWENNIDNNLEDADVIILLVSSSFFSSDYCCGVEMRRALERHDAGEALVIPVIVRSCIWTVTPLKKLQALPKDGKAVTIWADRDHAWTCVAEGIHKAIDTPLPHLLYQKICADGRNALLAQKVRIAPFLENLSQDKRIGLTLIVRPSSQVSKTLACINDGLKKSNPRQFYYDPSRFHFTILSLISASETAQVSKELQQFYQPIKEVLDDFLSFDVEFRGICATHNSVIAKGYPIGDALDRLRDALRYHLQEVGLGSDLEDRYRIEGAHITLARFKVQEDFSSLIKQLDKLGNIPLGQMRVRQAQLVLNDFYMSADKIQVIGLHFSDGNRLSTSPPLYQVATTQVKLHKFPNKPINMVGRDRELQRILTTLSESNKPVIIASGFGGIGKSTLAKMVAWTCAKEQKLFNFIAWVDTRQYDKSQIISLNFILDEIAKANDTTSDIPSINNLEIKQNIIREFLISHRSLLILDNYEDLLVDAKEEQKVSLFLNSLPVGPITDDTYIRILITTREVSLGLRALPIDDLRLQHLSLDDSLRLMKSRIPERLRLTDDQYRRIWELLCGLPKYMEIAIDQLRNITFIQWEGMVEDIRVPLDEGEKFFRDMFEHSWNRFTDDFRKILMSMTYFVGEAAPDALRKTSGLSERQFSSALTSASDAYIESTGAGYTVHPLTHAFCRAVLTSDDALEFREQSSRRFAEYFWDFTKTACDSNQSDLLERELRNIVVAARLADNLQKWNYLIGFRDNTTSFLRIRGYWQEQTEIARLAANACRQIGQRQTLAECLINDLGWLFLRFEELDEAEGYIKEGLMLYQELGHREGIAQATRHLGKSALLKGLDSAYEPDESWEKHSTEAEWHYLESLRIREELQQEGLDQRSNIADMKLDFGRLYWLQGKKYEQDGRTLQDQELIEMALRNYDQANKVSQEARTLFEGIGSKRGIAKAWGNLGNATKEIAKCMLKERQLTRAIQYAAEAHEFYEKSLEIAEKIKRKDEIAHARWGLAEIYILFADYPDLHSRTGNTHELQMKALDYAQESLILYKSLGGRKDINALEKLVALIRGKLR